MREKKKSEKKPLINIKTVSQISDILTQVQTGKTVEIEIGSGNGHFITEYGRKNWNSLLIGIEKKRKRCVKIIRKIEKRNLQNIEVIQGKAEDLLERLPPYKVDAFHIYFPDPWPKAKHRKRRFFRMINLDLLAKSLHEGGRVNFATDYFDYALQAKILLSLHGNFRLTESAPVEEVFLSVYATKFSDLQREIRFLSAIKTG
jgi:tRNA (guanine-N7-)-methyltransferase